MSAAGEMGAAPGDRGQGGAGWDGGLAVGGEGHTGRVAEGNNGEGEDEDGEWARQLRGFGHRVRLLLGAGAEIGQKARRGALGGRVGELAGRLTPREGWSEIRARFREVEGGEGVLCAAEIRVDGEILGGLWQAALWLRPLRREWGKRIRAAQLRLLWQQVPRAWFVVDEELPPQAVIPGLAIRRWGELADSRWGDEPFRLERWEGGRVVEGRAGSGSEVAGFLAGGAGEGWVLIGGADEGAGGGLEACYRRVGGRVQLR